MIRHATRLLAVLAIVMTSTLAHAHGRETHAGALGAPGNEADAIRTIEVVMKDNVFLPDTLQVQPGETVRFIVRNSGEFVHEFNIGTASTHARHREEMTTMMANGILEVDRINRHLMGQGSGMMAHDDPNAVLLAPGESGDVIWRFSDGDLEFACNVPGHYEDGMVGKIELTSDQRS